MRNIKYCDRNSNCHTFKLLYLPTLQLIVFVTTGAKLLYSVTVGGKWNKIFWQPNTVNIGTTNFYSIFGRTKVKVGVLRPVQQPGSYWDRSSELPLVGVEPTEVTAYD